MAVYVLRVTITNAVTVYFAALYVNSPRVLHQGYGVAARENVSGTL